MLLAPTAVPPLPLRILLERGCKVLRAKGGPAHIQEHEL
jgi:hypothetical protein